MPAIRALHIGATVLVAGVAAFECFVLPRGGAGRRETEFLHRRMRALCAAAALVAIVTWMAWLVTVAMRMSGLPLRETLGSDNLRTVALQTDFGHAWLLRAGLWIALAALLLPSREARPRRVAVALLAAATLASIAATGHALGAHRLHLVIDALHLLAAGVWVGMLPPLLWTIRRALATRAATDADLAIACTRRFAVPGVIAVCVVAVTGALNAWWLVGTPDALVSTPYGRMVLAKIALFALMAVLAAVNRFVLVPRLLRANDGAFFALQATVLAELTAGAVIVVIVGVLGVTPPAAHDHPGHPMHDPMAMAALELRVQPSCAHRPPRFKVPAAVHCRERQPAEQEKS